MGRGGICFVDGGTKWHPTGKTVQSLPEKDLIFLWSLLSPMASGSTVSWQYLLCGFERMSLEFSDSVSHSWKLWTQQRTVISHLLLALCRSWYPWGATTGPGCLSSLLSWKISPFASPGLPVASPENHLCISPVRQNSSRENLANSRLQEFCSLQATDGGFLLYWTERIKEKTTEETHRRDKNNDKAEKKSQPKPPST